MDADDFTDGAGGGGASIGGGLDGGDVARDDCGDEGIADLLHGAYQLNIGGFEHGVCAINEGDKAAGFEESDCFL